MKLETELFGIAPLSHLSLSIFSVHPTLLVRQGAALRLVVKNPVRLLLRLMIYQVVVHRMFLLSFL